MATSYVARPLGSPTPHAETYGVGMVQQGRPITPAAAPAGMGAFHQTAPAAPSAPSTPAAPAATAAPDPRDSTYWTNLAKLQFARQTQLDQLSRAQGYEDVDFAEANRRRAAQSITDHQGIKEQANREGLFFSGQLGKRYGEYDTKLAQQTADAQNAYDRSRTERTAQGNAISQGGVLDDNILLSDAGTRYLQNLLQNPPDAPPNPNEVETGSQVRDPRTDNTAVHALAGRGAIRAEGTGGGNWNVRFADGSLRQIRFVNGKPQVYVNGSWKAF